MAFCWECRLPDPYNGDGDGIGSCDCPRCPECRDCVYCGQCDCERDDWGLDEDDPDEPPTTITIQTAKDLL